jgi:hypothetical protein
MVIETILFLAFVIAVGDCHRENLRMAPDVLYGPYLAKQRRNQIDRGR